MINQLTLNLRFSSKLPRYNCLKFVRVRWQHWVLQALVPEAQRDAGGGRRLQSPRGTRARRRLPAQAREPTRPGLQARHRTPK
jgi:hypothetical protein